MNEFGRSFVLKFVFYCSKAKHSILSMMQLQEEGDQLTFQDMNCTLVLPDDCMLYGKFINKLLYLTDFVREGKYTAMITIRSQADRVQTDQSQANQSHADQRYPEDKAENNENSNESMNIIQQFDIIQ